ncbi:hypothetical protein GGG16DRAFT_126579 [Schizophyllum commune]
MTVDLYLVTGANCRLGIVLTRILALRDDTIVFAGARNPSESSDLLTLAGRFPKKVQLITFIPGDRESNVKTINDIRRSAGRLDVVEKTRLTKCARCAYPLLTDLHVQSTQLDAVEPIILLREAYDLLKWTPPAKPKFVIVANYDEAALGTRIYNFLDADVVEMPDVVLNWRAVHDDYPDLVFFPVCGDVVNTAGTSFIPNEEGIRHLPHITAEESATGILKLVDKATRETHNGYFWSFNGSKLPW